MKDKKRKNAKKLIVSSLILFIFVILFKLLFPIKEEGPYSIHIADKYFLLEQKATEEERQQGLSGRTALGQDKGLLFVFEKEGMYGFWMKDMKFPISIIWLDDKCQVTGFKDVASPKSFPEVFYPEKPSRYAVEINPIENTIKVGQKLNCDF